MTNLESAVQMSAVTHPAPIGTRGSVRESLSDRIMTATGSEHAFRLALSVDHRIGGLVITGMRALSDVRSLRLAHSDLVLIVDPTSHDDHIATADAPFYLPTPDGQLFPPTLAEVVSGQRDAGATVVTLPTGYIEAGETDAVRAVIDAGNQVAGEDILVPLFLAEGWLQPELVKFLRGAMARSAHPVAIALGSQTNPLASKKRLLLYRELFNTSPELPPRFAWRTDFAGIDAMAFGAAGAVVGVLPAQRRITPPAQKGKARNPKDKSPYVVMPGSLHYMKAGAMRAELFASEPAPDCPCATCGGRPVDRFTKHDAAEAHLHNLAMVQEISARLSLTPTHLRRQGWADLVHAAVGFHLELGRRVGRPVNAPKDVQTWAESLETAD
jgi:hypothetical protein